MPPSAASTANRIVDALVARQGLPRDRAETIAARLSRADADIVEAAAQWADTGDLPVEPTIAGHSPSTLGQRLSPSQVFTALVALRDNPAVARSTLQHQLGASPASRAMAFERSVLGMLNALPDVSDIEVTPRGPDGRARPDFVATVGGHKVIIEVKASPARPNRVRSAVEQVERYALVFQAVGGVIVFAEAPEPSVTLEGYLAPVAVTDPAHLGDAIRLIADRAAGSNT